MSIFLEEPVRPVPVVNTADVVVCGGGPAGIAAALSSARQGAKTILIEAHGALGGVWTSGSLSWILDHDNKGGIMREILQTLEKNHLRAANPLTGIPTCAYDPEGMKWVLDHLCHQATVEVRLLTHVTAALRAGERRLTHVITESKGGREAWAASVFIDCTGDGDLAAQAGCGFDMGRPENGEMQPLSLMALVTGLTEEKSRPFRTGENVKWGEAHGALRREMEKAGTPPSYAFPALFRIRDNLYALMANHQYNVRCDDPDAISQATRQARDELHHMIRALRSLGGIWENLTLVATGAQIGIREGRRIHGLHTVTTDDLITGARFPDAVCRATFPVDVHSPNPEKSKSMATENATIKAQPYDIPLRALIARDVDGLLLAGRCISGDFIAHSSYRVTGNAVALGEAAGVCAALAAKAGCLPQEIPFAEIARRIDLPA